jgi:hypothetical protein
MADLYEFFHLNMQMAQQQNQDNVSFISGKISQYDPLTHRCRVVIPLFTDGNGNYMETGWIQMGTLWVGNNFGMQIAPLGGATPTDPSGGEPVLLQVISQDAGLHIAGVQTFNSTVVAPGQNIPLPLGPVNIQPGEALIKHQTGSLIYLQNTGDVTIISQDQPATPPEQQPDTSDRTLTLWSAAGPANNETTATANLVAAGLTASNVTANASVAAFSGAGTSQSQSNLEFFSLSAAHYGFGNVIVNATGGTTNVRLSSSADTTALLILDCGSTPGFPPHATTTITVSGTNDSTLNTTVGINGTTMTATATTNVYGATDATAELNSSSPGSALVGLSATGSTNAVINIHSDGAISITGAGTINVNGGTINLNSGTVTAGNGAFQKLLNAAAAGVYNSHTHPNGMSGVTGTPNQPFVSADMTTNFTAS